MNNIFVNGFKNGINFEDLRKKGIYKVVCKNGFGRSWVMWTF